jgi:hypothetical protein
MTSRTLKSFFVATALLVAPMVAGSAEAATAKVGGTCKKTGSKSGTKAKPLVCSKTSKGLRWTAVKKTAAKSTDTTIAGKAKSADTTAKPKDTTVPKAADTTIAKPKAADTTVVKK